MAIHRWGCWGGCHLTELNWSSVWIKNLCSQLLWPWAWPHGGLVAPQAVAQVATAGAGPGVGTGRRAAVVAQGTAGLWVCVHPGRRSLRTAKLVAWTPCLAWCQERKIFSFFILAAAWVPSTLLNWQQQHSLSLIIAPLFVTLEFCVFS